MKNTKKVLHEDPLSADNPADEQLNPEEINVKIEDVKNMFNEASDVAQEVGRWSESTVQLFFMEFLRNVEATKQFILCQILFIPLLILFIFSLCVSVGIIAYSVTGYLLVGLTGFILAMGTVLGALIYWQTRLLVLFGFKETVNQLKEGLDVITKASQSSN